VLLFVILDWQELVLNQMWFFFFLSLFFFFFFFFITFFFFFFFFYSLFIFLQLSNYYFFKKKQIVNKSEDNWYQRIFTKIYSPRSIWKNDNKCDSSFSWRWNERRCLFLRHYPSWNIDKKDSLGSLQAFLFSFSFFLEINIKWISFIM